MAYEWTQQDADAYVAWCASMSIVDLTAPLHVWANESDLDPTAHNPAGHASGLFQLMPSTAAALGYDTTSDPTLAAYRSLSVAGQLAWATRYYAPYRAHLGTVAGLYLATFLPACLGLSDNPDATVCALGGPFAWAYAANHAFDREAKGRIIVQDLIDAAERAYGPRAQGIAALARAHAVTEPELVVTQPVPTLEDDDGSVSSHWAVAAGCDHDPEYSSSYVGDSALAQSPSNERKPLNG